jgi:DNA-binding transcriptional ArsR family regulator
MAEQVLYFLAVIFLFGYARAVSVAFEVLAEPARRRILDLLLTRPRLVGELTSELGLSQPGTSKHLRVLREAGLVRVRADAQRRWYELRPEPLVELDAWLAPYRRFWATQLDALERHLDAMSDTPPDQVTDDPSGQSAAQPRKDPP